MKLTLKFAPALGFTATPALAHEGLHLHPHGSENWLVGAIIVGTCVIVAGSKHVLRKRAEQRL